MPGQKLVMGILPFPGFQLPLKAFEQVIYDCEIMKILFSTPASCGFTYLSTFSTFTSCELGKTNRQDYLNSWI